MIRVTIVAALVAASAGARAEPRPGAQICSLGTAAVGQPGTLICKEISTGATTQSIAIGNTVVGSGATGGTLSRHGGHVLVTNVAGGAVLFRQDDGRLTSPVTLQTGGENSLSGAVGDRGAYVVTRTQVLYFPFGRDRAASSAALLVGDGSAAQVTLAGGFAYVSEKSGSLEAFALADDGNLAGTGSPVAGIPAGVIVGITGLQDLVVAPVAHLASNANQAAVPVASGIETVQIVPTKEVAACWAANDGREACITNPGSMTISCGQFGPGGFKSYTSAAANPVGETILDLDMTRDTVGVLGMHNGVPVLLAYARSAD
ncbi:MAG: hypothetical protein LC689_18620, partial [Myxococcales bacterium]|nr:hypothetical protein [Myxococcales bacterium]